VTRRRHDNGRARPVPPGSGLVGVRYRDGHVCRIRSPRMLGGAKPCPLAPIARDVAAGDIVHETVCIPSACHGPLHVTVVLHRPGRQPDPLPFAGLPTHDPRVGEATITIG
jgi:hypothetical protein